MKKKVLYIGCILSLVVVLLPVFSAAAYYREDFVYEGYKNFPIVNYRLYDPAGSGSYQQIKSTTSVGMTFKVEAKSGTTSGHVSASVNVEFSESIQTYTGSDSAKNGIGVGDTIVGYNTRMKLRVTGYVLITQSFYRIVITGVQIVEVNWFYERFMLSPADFKGYFGRDAPNPSASAVFVSTNRVLLSAGREAKYTYKLSTAAEESITVGGDVNFYGITLGLKATATFKQGYSLETTVRLYDANELLRHSLNFDALYAFDPTRSLFNTQGMIAWFGVEYPVLKVPALPI